MRRHVKKMVLRSEMHSELAISMKLHPSKMMFFVSLLCLQLPWG